MLISSCRSFIITREGGEKKCKVSCAVVRNNRPSREHDYVHRTIVTPPPVRVRPSVRPSVWVSPGGGGNVFSGTNLQFLAVAALATCTDRRPTDRSTSAAEGFSQADEGGMSEGCEKRREERQATSRPTDRTTRQTSLEVEMFSLRVVARSLALLRETIFTLMCPPPLPRARRSTFIV